MVFRLVWDRIVRRYIFSRTTVVVSRERVDIALRGSPRPEFSVRRRGLRFDDATPVFMGNCWVLDGDTISIGATRVRLWGIDAPELNHPYGKRAKWALHRLCKGQIVTVEVVGTDVHDRAVGICYLQDGRDLAAELVKQGLALDWPYFSDGKYAQFEPEGVRRKLWRQDRLQSQLSQKYATADIKATA